MLQVYGCINPTRGNVAIHKELSFTSLHVLLLHLQRPCIVLLSFLIDTDVKIVHRSPLACCILMEAQQEVKTSVIGEVLLSSDTECCVYLCP